MATQPAFIHMPSNRPAPLRILVVDDHPLVLWGVKRLLDGERPRMEVVATANSIAEALAALDESPVDVVLVDLDLGGESGVDAIRQFRAKSSARVLVLTGLRDAHIRDAAVVAGACGVVSKEDSAEVIVKAIERAAAGEVWLDRASTGRLFMRLLHPEGEEGEGIRDPIAGLTAREREIVMAMVSDAQATPKKVAARLCISEHTLRNHLTSIYDKLGVASRLELWDFARSRGLVNPSPREGEDS
jgi:two-component system, NarL family, nitrate/nitrite response regulator NarL